MRDDFILAFSPCQDHRFGLAWFYVGRNRNFAARRLDSCSVLFNMAYKEKAGFFFQEEIELILERIISDNLTNTQAIDITKRIMQLFKDLPEINSETAEETLRNIAKEHHLKAGQVFGLLREILTGQEVSPPIFDVISIIGKEKVLSRLEGALEIFQ